MKMPESAPSSPPSGPATRLASGRGMVIVAALLWSTSGIFAKAPWFDDWPVETRGLGLAFWRAVFAALAVALFVRRVEWRPGLIPMAGCFVVMTYAFLMSMVMGSEAATIWLQYVAPAWVGIAGYLGWGDRPQRADRPMMIASLLAVGFIVTMQATYGAEPLQTQALGLGLLSGVLFAGVVLSLRHLRSLDPAWLGFVNHAATVICLAPLVLGRLPMPSGWQWLALALLGSVQLAIPYLLFARAVQRVPSAEASLLTLVEPIAVPVWTLLLWSHLDSYRAPPWWVLVAGAAICVGFVFRFWAWQQLRRAAEPTPASQ